eukprot:9127038-Pyramimonas_sp.AAC.1
MYYTYYALVTRIIRSVLYYVLVLANLGSNTPQRRGAPLALGSNAPQRRGAPLALGSNARQRRGAPLALGSNVLQRRDEEAPPSDRVPVFEGKEITPTRLPPER